ncbi:MAG TPA: DGQHR domain-containing protein [Dehalococcoidia bacterium]|nr:DGQHR domain-containing protein [Dehalococcoidia bacterium]
MTTSENTMEGLRKFAESAKKIMRVPALKGHLGGVDFYIITLSLAEVPRYIVGTDPNPDLSPKLRENRRANPARFAEIADYIVCNQNDYRFSAITCTYGKNGTDHPDNWEPADPDAPKGSPGWMLGMLTLNQQDPLVIVDGQHRLGAIEKAIDIEPELRNDSIAVVLFPYIDLRANQQLFSDLNRIAKPPTKSLNILFDYRDITNRVVQKVVEGVSVFKGQVNLELVSVAKSPNEMFTLAGIYQASEPMIIGSFKGGLLQKELSQENNNEDEYVKFLFDAWEFIAEQFPEWGKVASGQISLSENRKKYLHWNSGVLSSIGEFIGTVMRKCAADWKETVKTDLTHPDNANWRRDMPQWQGLVLAGDQVLPRSAVRIQLIAYLKLKVGLPLTDGENKALLQLDHAVQKKIGFQP